tara:strand:+ start:573 stop:737 length:165 start_codon:yes stop_codon:yes gene_type:complete
MVEQCFGAFAGHDHKITKKLQLVVKEFLQVGVDKVPCCSMQVYRGTFIAIFHKD